MAESGAGAGRDLPEQAKNQGDKERLKTVKERQHEERQRKLEEIKTQALAAQRFKEQKEMERRRRMEELKGKEDVRRQQVEERKRAIYQAEQERAESILRRNQVEREARIEAKRRNERSNIVFAFGSSTPRMLDPTDISTTSFWGTRRATSIQNITSTSNVPLTRRQSERDLDGGSKKRAISAGGLERAGESGSSTAQSPAGCVSGYVGRRRTDLMPTIPSRDSSFTSATQQRKSHNQSPGRAFSMSRLDQLAKPRVLKKTTADMPAVVETIPATRYPYQSPTTFTRPLSAAPKQTFTRSMSHLNAVGKTATGIGGHNAQQSSSITVSSQAATTKKATLSKTNSRSFHQLSGDGAAAAFVFAHPRPTRATQLRQQRLQASAANANIGDASSRPSSSLSQQSTTSSVSVRHRPSTAPRRPRPASIAITGISQDHHLKSSTYTILTDGQKANGRKPPVIPPASNASSGDKTGHLKSSTYTTLVDEKTAKNLPVIPGKQSQLKSTTHSNINDEKKETKTETKPPLKKTRTFNKEKLTLKDKVVISTSRDGTVQQQIVKSPDAVPSEPLESIGNAAAVDTAEIGAGDAKPEPEPQQETATVEDSVQEITAAAAPATTTTEESATTGDQIKVITTELIRSESLGEAPLPQQPVNPPPPVVDDVNEPVPATSLENQPIEMETVEIKSSNQDENNAVNLEKSDNEMTQSFSKIRINTEEEAKAALAERRRLAREEAERQAEQERLRIEMEAQAELERQRMEEEQVQRLIEQQRIAEQERLDEAIREKQRAEEEERLRKEEEQRTKLQKEEADRKAREEAEKKAAEQAERLKNEEKEREARRKRVEAIMRRTRGANNANTPTPQNSEDQNENDQKAEKVNGSQNAEEKNGTDNEKEVDIVDNIIPDDSVKNANTVSSDTTISTDSINSNNTWQATQQYGNTVNNNNNN